MAEKLYNPCGLMIQPGNVNKAEILRHVKAAGYNTCSVLDDRKLTIDLNIPYGVFRDFNFEPEPGNNPEEAAKSAIRHIRSWERLPGQENIYIMVNCERSFTKERLDMYAHMALIASRLNPSIGFVFGNFASGAIKSGQGPKNIVNTKGEVIHTNNNRILPTNREIANGWRERNEWYEKAEFFIRTLHSLRHVKLPLGTPAFILGTHDYTGIHPWIAVNEAENWNKPLWEYRPSSIDWSKPQWHLGRTDQALMQCYAAWNIPKEEAIPVIKTESLLDDMDDVAYLFGNRATGNTGLKLHRGFPMWEQFNKSRGFRSLRPQYADWYPGRDLYAIYADMVVWTWETIYAPLEWVIGTHTYCYGDNSGSQNKWWSFRVD